MIYDIRNRETFYTRPVKSVYKGTDSLSFLAHKIWELISKGIKSIDSLSALKITIKQWKLNDCPCRLCYLTYIQHVGYV